MTKEQKADFIVERIKQFVNALILNSNDSDYSSDVYRIKDEFVQELIAYKIVADD